jgi:polyhydroxybutyrate depolymerase
MLRTMFLLRLFTCLILIGNLHGAVPDGFQQREWLIQGSQRVALLRIPKSHSGKMPVLFCWHGHGGTAEHAIRAWGIPAEWPEALLVFPQGLPTPGQLTDPEGHRTGWQSKAGTQNNRDLEFFDRILASLRSENQIDDKRIYSTGHSNGGGFSYLLWEQRPAVFAAIAPVAATLNRFDRPNSPLPVLHLAGRNDRLVQFSWQQATCDAIRSLNHCDPNPIPWADHGSLSAQLFASTRGAPVVVAIHPGGHEYPSGAAKLIVRFCKEHQRN